MNRNLLLFAILGIVFILGAQDLVKNTYSPLSPQSLVDGSCFGCATGNHSDTNGPGDDNLLFSDDFSTDPNFNGLWNIIRYAFDFENEAGWDSQEHVLFLTRAVSDKAVAMFANHALTERFWEATFRYKAGGGTGADGFTFMFYKNQAAYGRPGAGGGLGFILHDNIPVAGYGIEFDNYHNNFESSDRHIALIKDNVDNHLTSRNDPRTEDNQWHDARIAFNSGRISVYVDNDRVLEYTIPNVDYTYSGVGFSSATGGEHNNHIIDNFELRGSSLELTCKDPLEDYKDQGTDCVYRRGPDKAFNIELEYPVGGTNPRLTITDPDFQDPDPPEGTTETMSTTVVISPTKMQWQVRIPDDNPIGIYTLTARVDLDGETLTSEELQVKVIFEVPESLRRNDPAIRAYLYDEAGILDQRSYIFGPGRSGTTYGPNGAPWDRSWPETLYRLYPQEKNLFDKTMKAVHGEDDPRVVAERLMHMISNFIQYDHNNINSRGYYESVPRLFARLTEQDFQNAYGEGTDISGAIPGQCLDYANGLAAVMRSIGIPARVATKIEKYNHGPGAYDWHQWTEAYLEHPWDGDGTDHWFMYDAMDDNNDGPPAGSGRRADGNVGNPPTNFAVQGFEIIVGGTTWRSDGGILEIVDIDPTGNTRFGVQRKPNTPILPAEALFEKCENRNYPDINCPNAIPPAPAVTPLNPVSHDPSLSIALSQAEYRVGDTVSATVYLTNTESTPRMFNHTSRYFERDSSDDGRLRNGDPSRGITGTGVLGSTLLEATESITIPGNTVVERVYSVPITDTLFPSSNYGIEVTSTVAMSPVHELAGFDVAPSYDLTVGVPPAPRIDDPLTITATLTNRVNFPISNLDLSLEPPEFFVTSEPLSRQVPTLDVGASVQFIWNLRAWNETTNSPEIASLQHFQIRTSSDNGGSRNEPLEVQLIRPATPAIDLINLPQQVLIDQPFQATYRVTNIGDSPLLSATASLFLPPEISASEPLTRTIGDLAPRQSITATWTLTTSVLGAHLVTLVVQDESSEHSDSLDKIIQVDRWLVGHLTWQGRPGQPGSLQQLPVTLTLKSGTTEVNYSGITTDASGFFTVPVTELINGTYNWRVKGPDSNLNLLPTDPPGFLANAGTVVLSGAPQTDAEMGLLRAGDCNNDNLVNASDFNITKVSFGRRMGEPAYDDRADFTGDSRVTVLEFNLMKINFGSGGAPPLNLRGSQ